ncbi:hypothetical protein [Candidatus Harpocratesius sp.]
MKTQVPQKFSLKEIRAAGLTLDQVRKHKLLIDKRRKGMDNERITYLKSLGIPAQYTGPKPQPPKIKTRIPKKRKVQIKKPKTVEVKTIVKPKSGSKSAKKPAVKPKVKPSVKPVKKTIEKPVEKPAKKPTKKQTEKSEEKNTFTKDTSKSLDPKVQDAISKIFKDTPLFTKKSDLLEAIEKHVASITDMNTNQIFDKLKNENIIKYSRTAPRGYSLN